MSRSIVALCLWITALGGVSYAAAPQAASLGIAVAANMSDCITAIDAAFIDIHPGTDIKLSTGASGNFYAQIKNGAPFDVFVSADVDYPKKLADEGFADPKTLTSYAFGQLALWTLRDDIDLKQGLALLNQASVKRIAIANPKLAPYGRAAQAAMTSAGIWDQVQGKLVVGENISQTAQFVQTGNADVGLVAASLLKSPATLGLGQMLMIPKSSYPPLEQAAVVTRHGADQPLAATYLAFLTSVKARAILQAYGYDLPATQQP